MDRFFIDRGGRVEEFAGKRNRRTVEFPVCLQLRYEKDRTLICCDFILNISRAGIFIRTDADLGPGTRVLMRFYIPPGERLLGEFSGTVIRVNSDNRFYPKGVSVSFTGHEPSELQKLGDFLEGKRHLLDEMV